MMKRTLRVDNHIDSNVKAGDKVRLTNDETLTHVVYDGNYDLLRKYPSLGINKPLEEMEGFVLKTGITNFVAERDGKFVTITQDIIVNIEGQMFRTASGAVRVIKTPEEVIDSKIESLKSLKSKAKKVTEQIELLEELRDEINNHK